MAKEGLAFGIKLRFDETAKEYDTPRYRVPNGILLVPGVQY
jgi:hypothetical protein